MGKILNFRSDSRISQSVRAELREFTSVAGQRVDALAKRLGVRVDEELLPMDVSAVLIHSPDCGSASGYRIAVNSRHSFERRRLSIAHELGHFVLHRNDPRFVPVEDDTDYAEVVPLFGDEANSYRAGATRATMPELEDEADAFAIQLLMPAYTLRRNANFRMNQVKELARDYGVSILAMKIRISEMRFAQAKRCHETHKAKLARAS